MFFQRISFFITICLLTISSSLTAQLDTIVMDEVEVRGTTIREKSVGGISQNWNTDKASISANDLGSLLNQNGIFIKSYGANSLATSSIRGGSAGHTLVLWNGLPIQSPMLGLLDLSLIPLNTAEKVTLKKGGSSAMWGSGAIGGVVDLQNEADFDNRLSIASQTTAGSFGQFGQQLQVSIGNQKIQSKTKIFHQQASNDFYYPIAPNFPERQQTNAAFSQNSILQDLHVQLNNGHRIGFHLWQQHAEKQIPPTNVQVRSAAYQEDKFTRLMADWQQVRKHIVIKSKVAWFREHLNFIDTLTAIDSRSRFNTMLGDLNVQRSWQNRHHLLVGSTFSNTRIEAGGYSNNPSENRAALFTSYRFQKEKLQIQASLRQELVDDQWIPITPVLAADFQAFNFLTIKGKISRNYRLPTFNDRFWTPGGNPDLLAESGWSEEATLQWQLQKGAFQFQWTNTFFNRNIDNWIMWSRLEGQSFWSANNITEVWSRGLEERLEVTFVKKNITIQLQLGYDRIRSTNEVALKFPNIEKGTQLWYTPRHQAFANLGMDWKGLSANYRHLFRSASSGVNELLEEYHTGDFTLKYQLSKQKWSASIFFTAINIWDINYFVVEQRPIAGRHFQGGLKWAFGG